MTATNATTITAIERYAQAQHARDAALTTAQALSKRLSAAKTGASTADWSKIAAWQAQVAAEQERAQFLDGQLEELRLAASAEIRLSHQAALALVRAELSHQLEALAQALAPAIAEAQRAARSAGADALKAARELPTEGLARDDRHDHGWEIISLRDDIAGNASALMLSQALSLAGGLHQ